MTLSRAIKDADENTLGAMFMHVDMSATNSAIRQVIFDVLLCACIAVFVVVLTVSYITGRITRPITEMNNTVQRFTKGDFEARLDIKSSDEVGQLAMSFNNMADELNTLEQARKTFVANVSHEMRSPLTSMRGFLEAMQDGTISQEDYGKYLDVVIAENKRMTAMVNDLLDLARIESGEYAMNRQTFDVNEVIRRILITFEARISGKRLAVETDFKQNHCYVESDLMQISQVIHNLVDNAIKFSNDGGKLIVSTDCSKRDALVKVKDFGPGIAAEDLPYVFDRFYKGEKAHTPSGHSGTGLGLSIVKRIIDSQGQTIVVKSEEGAWTEFAFTLKRSSEQAMRAQKQREQKEK